MQTNFEDKIFLWVQLTHENVTQQINFMTIILKKEKTTVYHYYVYYPTLRSVESGR